MKRLAKRVREGLEVMGVGEEGSGEGRLWRWSKG